MSNHETSIAGLPKGIDIQGTASMTLAGLGILASEASRVTDEMFAVAAKALDEQVSEEDFMLGRIYPSLSRIREVSVNIALAIAKVAFARGLTAAIPEPADLHSHIKSKMYDPTYQEYV
jgi:malate dehydrogenase (oxaloacetate-decarboxylating)(NADP+)